MDSDSSPTYFPGLADISTPSPSDASLKAFSASPDSSLLPRPSRLRAPSPRNEISKRTDVGRAKPSRLRTPSPRKEVKRAVDEKNHVPSSSSKGPGNSRSGPAKRQERSRPAPAPAPASLFPRGSQITEASRAASSQDITASLGCSSVQSKLQFLEQEDSILVPRLLDMASPDNSGHQRRTTNSTLNSSYQNLTFGEPARKPMAENPASPSPSQKISAGSNIPSPSRVRKKSGSAELSLQGKETSLLKVAPETRPRNVSLLSMADSPIAGKRPPKMSLLTFSDHSDDDNDDEKQIVATPPSAPFAESPFSDMSNDFDKSRTSLKRYSSSSLKTPESRRQKTTSPVGSRSPSKLRLVQHTPSENKSDSSLGGSKRTVTDDFPSFRSDDIAAAAVAALAQHDSEEDRRLSAASTPSFGVRESQRKEDGSWPKQRGAPNCSPRPEFAARSRSGRRRRSRGQVGTPPRGNQVSSPFDTPPHGVKKTPEKRGFLAAASPFQTPPQRGKVSPKRAAVPSPCHTSPRLQADSDTSSESELELETMELDDMRIERDWYYQRLHGIEMIAKFCSRWCEQNPGHSQFEAAVEAIFSQLYCE